MSTRLDALALLRRLTASGASVRSVAERAQLILSRDGSSYAECARLIRWASHELSQETRP